MEEVRSLTEDSQIFTPLPEFVKKANVTPEIYKDLCNKANTNYTEFWGDLAKQYIIWNKSFNKILNESEAPFYKWFEDGELNVSYNCIDRHLESKANKVAIIFEADGGKVTKVTYQELHKKVCHFANGLKAIGVTKGDRVVIYMPHSIEAIVVMQACARIGAIHSVVFGGFSAKSLAERIVDANAQYLVTVDGYMRGGKKSKVKDEVDNAIALIPKTQLKHVVIQNRINEACKIEAPRDIWWEDLIKNTSEICVPEPINSEHPLFILYTSGSTGKPKGVQHSSAGYLLGAIITMQWVFDYKESDVFWCTADIGWITGHTYVCYGPLAVGATQVIFEGIPTYPDASRFWQNIEKHKVSVFYTAPTAIRALIKLGADLPNKFDLSSLRLLGSVGEPINPEAWRWYYDVVGKKKCPIVDTWWQTETGCNMLTPLPGVTALKPGACSFPIPGIFVGVVDDKGHDMGHISSGSLVIKKPFPSQIRTIWGDAERFKKAYFSKEIADGKYYLAGDSAYLDTDGYYWVLGRLDDILKVSGHRLDTMEIESALVSHPSIAEAAVVGKPHDIKGESVFAFVVCKNGKAPTSENMDSLKTELRNWVGNEIGAIAKPDDIRFGDSLPKTRSGKIMRRLLRSIARGEAITQDISTLENPAVIEQLQREQ